MIKSISIITAQGAKVYCVGDRLSGGVVAVIKLDEIRFTGDPYTHYCGYDENGKLLFNVEPSCPHECEYL